MASKNMIRIRLKAYDHQLIDKAAETIVAAAKRTGAPAVRGRRLKIYYGLQVSTNPQTIRLFVNDPKLATPAYLAYIERNLRANFGLEGAPIRIFLKARQRGRTQKYGIIPDGDE